MKIHPVEFFFYKNGNPFVKIQSGRYKEPWLTPQEALSILAAADKVRAWADALEAKNAPAAAPSDDAKAVAAELAKARAELALLKAQSAIAGNGARFNPDAVKS